MTGADVESVDEVQVGDRVAITGIVRSVHRAGSGLQTVSVECVTTDGQRALGTAFTLTADALAFADAITRDLMPLPTEPGTRFWGTYNKTAPCWWFVMSDKRDGGGVRYVSQYGIGDGHPSGIHSTSLAADRLVRLPDPEVTP